MTARAQHSASLRAITARQLQALVRRRALPRRSSAPRATRRPSAPHLGKLVLGTPRSRPVRGAAGRQRGRGVVGRGELLFARASRRSTRALTAQRISSERMRTGWDARRLTDRA